MKELYIKRINCAHLWSRADKIINSEDGDYEMMKQAREFLMSVYSKLEEISSGLGQADPAVWHPELLKTILHYQQGCLSMVLGDLPNAENELKVS